MKKLLLSLMFLIGLCSIGFAQCGSGSCQSVPYPHARHQYYSHFYYQPQPYYWSQPQPYYFYGYNVYNWGYSAPYYTPRWYPAPRSCR